jgi:tetratricopeptide (TPR) repeat protein
MLINRPNFQRPRVFPTPAEISTGDARPDLFSSVRSPFGLFRGRQPGDRLGYVCWLHYAAIQAEIEGFQRRADFYWRECDRHLACLTRKAAILTAAMRSKMLAPPHDNAGDLGSVFVDEVLIDVHAAFFNGRAQRSAELTLEDRAFYHLNRLEKVLPYSSLSPAERVELLLPVWLHRGHALRSAKRWPEAIALAEKRLSTDPHNLESQNWFVETWFERTISMLQSEPSQSATRTQSHALHTAVSALEHFRTVAPHNGDVYQALSTLYHYLAVNLANARQPSQALLWVQKALTINPGFAEAQQTRGQLIEAMKGLQARMKEVDAELQSRPNVTLTPEGRAFRQEAQAGFGPYNRFVESEEARLLHRQAEEARNRTIWRAIGLPEPQQHFDEQAERLFVALNEVAAAEPGDKVSIAETWRQVSSKDPDLQAIDIDNVSGFLANRLLGESWQKPAPAVPEPPLVQPPILSSRTDLCRGGQPPISAWLYSGQDLALKMRLLAIVILVSVAGVLFSYELEQYRTRDDAYVMMSDLGAKRDYPGVVKAANGFFSARSFSRDPREQEVRTASQEALVRWITDLPGNPTTTDQSLIAEYHRLVASH